MGKRVATFYLPMNASTFARLLIAVSDEFPSAHLVDDEGGDRTVAHVEVDDEDG